MNDKSWRFIRNRQSNEYIAGVEKFLEIAQNHKRPEDGFILCPCRDCLNTRWHPISTLAAHLFDRGMAFSYEKWIYHGEDIVVPPSTCSGNSMRDNEGNSDDEDNTASVMFDERPDQAILDDIVRGTTSMEDDYANNLGDEGDDKFSTLLEDAQREVYPGCKKFSLLTAVIEMLHLKVEGRQSTKSFNKWLEFLKNILPTGEILPSTYYEARKMLRDLGMEVQSIHACENDCILFWKEFSDLDSCPQCKTSRWKEGKGKKKKVPHKVLRYFPLKPRLQRLFMSNKTAKDMRWHKEEYVKEENLLRHPSDSIIWKDFDAQFPWFAVDARNVRLGLAIDGFNPFGNMSNSYSVWPVILFPYNVPPWKCMKDPYIMLSLIIPGPESPGKEIDVFLQPLVEELKNFWCSGVRTYDAVAKEKFQLHVALLWTIHDFPAYGDISGWTTKGYNACPVCNVQSSSSYRQSKLFYTGHRRYLPENHSWRRSRKFDGSFETRPPPREVSMEQLMSQLQSYVGVNLGKAPGPSKRKRIDDGTNWCKKSILFDLPYWEKNALRHNLDVMHIEKNVCDNIIGTVLNIKGKTKDTEKARLALQEMRIRKELHLRRVGEKLIKPAASFTLPSKKIDEFCKFLKEVRFPDGYAANISNALGHRDGKLKGLKSHDSHILLQRILPIGLRGQLDKGIYAAISQLSRFFRELCAKELKMDTLVALEESIIFTLCKLEMIFPPAFFDVMIHLMVHLPREARLGGPVQYRWMYPVERYLCGLKAMVRNKARPEGSIVEAYLLRECLLFCALYLEGIETRFNRLPRLYDCEVQQHNQFSVFSQRVRPITASKYVDIGDDSKKMHWYILNNCEEIETFIREFEDEVSTNDVVNIQRHISEEFPRWLQEKVLKLKQDNATMVSDSLYSIACGPSTQAHIYSGCIVNGVKFLTKERDSLTTQNSGVCVEGYHKGESLMFFGHLVDVIELKYLLGFKVYLFKCVWYDLERHKPIFVDDDLTSINTSKSWYENDPYALADQVCQVFYIRDSAYKSGDWQVVQKAHHRSFYNEGLFRVFIDDINNEETSNEEIAFQQETCANFISIDKIFIDIGPLEMRDVDGEEVLVCGQHVDTHMQMNEINDSTDCCDEGSSGSEEEETESTDYSSDEFE